MEHNHIFLFQVRPPPQRNSVAIDKEVKLSEAVTLYLIELQCSSSDIYPINTSATEPVHKQPEGIREPTSSLNLDRFIENYDT